MKIIQLIISYTIAAGFVFFMSWLNSDKSFEDFVYIMLIIIFGNDLKNEWFGKK